MNTLFDGPSARSDRRNELAALAEPLLYSPAVQRLAGVTFLGILSPKFRETIPSPLWPHSTVPAVDDGSRYDHTLGVAILALELARQLKLTERGQRYAVAWGLTHDIATWPLSHTSEPAFTRATGISSRQLRAAMLLGRADLPRQYDLTAALRESGIVPDTLAKLFEPDSTTADEELAVFKQAVVSPLTPDALEGTTRTGAVFGVPVVSPEDVLATLFREGGTVRLHRTYLKLAWEFWRSKSAIYHLFINREDVIRWESAWAVAILEHFSGIALEETLKLTEDAIISAVKRFGLPVHSSIVRYKQPQQYLFDGDYELLSPEPPVSELWRVFRREPIVTVHE